MEVFAAHARLKAGAVGARKVDPVVHVRCDVVADVHADIVLGSLVMAVEL